MSGLVVGWFNGRDELCGGLNVKGGYGVVK